MVITRTKRIVRFRNYLGRHHQACVSHSTATQTSILFFNFWKTPSIISVHSSIYGDRLSPLASDAIYWREQLFDFVSPVTVTAEKFGEIWPLFSCIYRCRKTEKRFKDTLEASQYECRLRKSRESSNVCTRGNQFKAATLQYYGGQ